MPSNNEYHFIVTFYNMIDTTNRTQNISVFADLEYSAWHTCYTFAKDACKKHEGICKIELIEVI